MQTRKGKETEKKRGIKKNIWLLYRQSASHQPSFHAPIIKGDKAQDIEVPNLNIRTTPFFPNKLKGKIILTNIHTQKKARI